MCAAIDMLAYIDISGCWGPRFFCLIPFVVLIKKAKAGGDIVAH